MYIHYMKDNIEPLSKLECETGPVQHDLRNIVFVFSKAIAKGQIDQRYPVHKVLHICTVNYDQ